MGWLQEKYVRSYFTGTDDDGNHVPAADGFSSYQMGKPRTYNQNLLAQLDFKGKHVLDLGFGRGEMMKYAIEHGAANVTGVDFSQDAYDLATELFRKFQLAANFYCNDILSFLNGWLEKEIPEKFDIVLMFDVVEHIPRTELTEIFTKMHYVLTNQATILINTPVFAVDNDVIKDGLDPRAMDSSDEYESTSGMHCNRYTKQSLQRYMYKLNYAAISGHFFARNFLIPEAFNGSRFAWLLAQAKNYPINSSRLWQKDQFEFGLTIAQQRQRDELLLSKQGQRSLLRRLAKRALHTIGLQRIPYSVAERKPQPGWITVMDKLLVEYELYLDPESPAYWSQEMASGVYEADLFKLVGELLNSQSAIIWDVGAHLGYHSMVFGQLVTPKGQVIAFEPNPYNIERFKMIMARNSPKTDNIRLLPIALGNSNGKARFRFSANIDYGQSSGSHLVGSSTPYESEIYVQFEEMDVQVVTADILIDKGEVPVPAIIKIDIEGAELEMLNGSQRLLSTHCPVLLLEIHSAANVLRVQQFLEQFNYSMKLLEDKHASPARCSIIATAKRK